MRTRALQYASLVVPVALWAAGTQLGQLLPHVDCQNRSHWTLLACIAEIAVAMAAVVAGLWHSRFEGGAGSTLLGNLCGAAGLVFVFALALQGTASVLVFACER